MEEGEEQQPAWVRSVSLQVGHARMKYWSSLVAAGAVGFAAGAFARVPFKLEVGALVLGIVVSWALSMAAGRALAKASRIQQEAFSGMKVREIVAPPETGKKE